MRARSRGPCRDEGERRHEHAPLLAILVAVGLKQAGEHTLERPRSRAHWLLRVEGAGQRALVKLLVRGQKRVIELGPVEEHGAGHVTLGRSEARRTPAHEHRDAPVLFEQAADGAQRIEHEAQQIAARAQDRPGLPGDLERLPHVVQLAHAHVRRQQPSLVLHPPEVEREQRPLVELHGHIGELALRELEPADRATPLLARLRVLERGLEAGAGGGSTEGGRGTAPTSFATAGPEGAGSSACERFGEGSACELFGASARLIWPTSSE